MGEAEAVVAIVAIACGTGLTMVLVPIWIIKRYLDHKLRIAELRARETDTAIQERLRPALEEVARLRRETNDLILSFDATLARLESRLQRLEERTLGPGERVEALPSGRKDGP